MRSEEQDASMYNSPDASDASDASEFDAEDLRRFTSIVLHGCWIGLVEQVHDSFGSFQREVLDPAYQRQYCRVRRDGSVDRALEFGPYQQPHEVAGVFVVEAQNSPLPSRSNIVPFLAVLDESQSITMLPQDGAGAAGRDVRLRIFQDRRLVE